MIFGNKNDNNDNNSSSKTQPFSTSTSSRRPICVTDIAKRSSPASPANARASTKIQHASRAARNTLCSFNGILMGFIVIQSDINGIYPLVN